MVSIDFNGINPESLPGTLRGTIPTSRDRRPPAARDVSVGVDEERHVGQSITHGDGFDEGPLGHPGRVGDQGERLIRRQLECSVADLLPDHAMDPLRIPHARREEVDDQEMDTLLEELHGLIQERLDRISVTLVPE